LFEGSKSWFKQQISEFCLAPLANRLLVGIPSFYGPPAKSREVQPSSIVSHPKFKTMRVRSTRENVNITDRMFAAVHPLKRQLYAMSSGIADELS
jgi:hypothetical protein